MSNGVQLYDGQGRDKLRWVRSAAQPHGAAQLHGAGVRSAVQLHGTVQLLYEDAPPHCPSYGTACRGLSQRRRYPRDLYEARSARH